MDIPLIKSNPVPHVVIDNFLGTANNQRLLTAIECVRDDMNLGTVNHSGIEQVDDLKRNRNLWLDPFDETIAGFFKNYIFQINVDHPELDHLQINGQSRAYSILLSKYTNKDYYDWHTDLNGHCTWNYFCYREPRKFVGGDFLLSDCLHDATEFLQTEIIECVNDRLIIFPAKYQHSVSQMNTDVGERYSIQIFFSE
jgi:hypothetical protein